MFSLGEETTLPRILSCKQTTAAARFIMAAPAEKGTGVCEDSSSSDDEELRRCQEAVWETRGDLQKDVDNTVKPSKRVIVAVHEHDGNELQVTEGFRTHVAKKLGNLLDSCITETQTEASTCVVSAKCDDDDEGFRLFSTSVPGQTADDTPPPGSRRPLPSSSDSDSEMEMRLKEAAVSVTDLIPSMLASSAELHCSETPQKKKTQAEGEEESCAVKKKKKKRKQNKEENDTARSMFVQSSGEHESSEQEVMPVKVKRKKKRKQEGNTEEALN